MSDHSGNILTNNLELPSGRTIYSRSRGSKINLSNSSGTDENIIRFFYRTSGGMFLNTVTYSEIPHDAVLLKTLYE